MKSKTMNVFAGILLLVSLCWDQRAMAQTLVLHHADGTVTDVELYTQPRVEFQGDRVLIISPVLNMDYAKTDILRFTYKGGTVAVKNVKNQADCTQRDDQLVFHGITQQDKVAVYNANGVRLPVRIKVSGTDAMLSLNSIPKGVYLLSVNGRTSKFTKQ